MQHKTTHEFTSSISTLYRHSDTLIIGNTNGTIESFPADLNFTSHAPAYDYLESTDISEKITCISSIELGDGRTHIITGNERSVKLWTIEKSRNQRMFDFVNELSSTSVVSDLSVNKTEDSFKYRKSRLMRNFGDLHLYTLHGISTVPCTHTFLTVDYLQIMLHNLEYPSLSLLNIKPGAIENLVFLITSLNTCTNNNFLYTTSNGNCILNDMRIQPRGIAVSEYSTDTFISNSCIEGNYCYLRTSTGVSVIDLRCMDKPVSVFKIDDQGNNGNYDKVDIRVCDRDILTGGYYGKIHVIGNEKLKSMIVGEGVIRNVEWEGKQVVCGVEKKLYVYNRV